MKIEQLTHEVKLGLIALITKFDEELPTAYGDYTTEFKEGAEWHETHTRAMFNRWRNKILDL